MNQLPATDIIVVRHGQTIWNRERRIQGHSDSPLTELGVRQTEAVARSLSRLTIDRVYTSDLGRALAMAEAIAGSTSAEIITRHCLRERHYGIFEGLTFQEIEERFPEQYGLYRERRDLDVPVPGGESLRQRHERVIACLQGIARRHARKTVVVVSHGGVLDSLFRFVLGIELGTPRNFALHNASRNRFQVCGPSWFLEEWGDLRHLSGQEPR